MPITDDYTGQSSSSVMTFSKAFETITPDDDNDLPVFYKGIVCGETGGAVVVHNEDGDEVTLWAVPGQLLQGVRPRRILAAGTDATPLIGLR